LSSTARFRGPLLSCVTACGVAKASRKQPEANRSYRSVYFKSVPNQTALHPRRLASPSSDLGHPVGAGHTIACRPKPKEINCRIVKELPAGGRTRQPPTRFRNLAGLRSKSTPPGRRDSKNRPSHRQHASRGRS